MPKIPLYNQGAGPTVGVAAGQLSPRASAAAFTAPGKAAMGYQKVFSDIGNVAAEFALKEQEAQTRQAISDISIKSKESWEDFNRNNTAQTVSEYEAQASAFQGELQEELLGGYEGLTGKQKATLSQTFNQVSIGYSLAGKQTAHDRNQANRGRKQDEFVEATVETMRGLNPEDPTYEFLQASLAQSFLEAREQGLALSYDERGILKDLKAGNFKSELASAQTQEDIERLTSLNESDVTLSASEKQENRSAIFTKKNRIEADTQERLVDATFETIIRTDFAGFSPEQIEENKKALLNGEQIFVMNPDDPDGPRIPIDSSQLKPESRQILVSKIETFVNAEQTKTTENIVTSIRKEVNDMTIPQLQQEITNAEQNLGRFEGNTNDALRTKAIAIYNAEIKNKAPRVLAETNALQRQLSSNIRSNNGILTEKDIQLKNKIYENLINAELFDEANLFNDSVDIAQQSSSIFNDIQFASIETQTETLLELKSQQKSDPNPILDGVVAKLEESISSRNKLMKDDFVGYYNSQNPDTPLTPAELIALQKSMGIPSADVRVLTNSQVTKFKSDFDGIESYDEKGQFGKDFLAQFGEQQNVVFKHLVETGRLDTVDQLTIARPQSVGINAVRTYNDEENVKLQNSFISNASDVGKQIDEEMLNIFGDYSSSIIGSFTDGVVDPGLSAGRTNHIYAMQEVVRNTAKGYIRTGTISDPSEAVAKAYQDVVGDSFVFEKGNNDAAVRFPRELENVSGLMNDVLNFSIDSDVEYLKSVIAFPDTPDGKLEDDYQNEFLRDLIRGGGWRTNTNNNGVYLVDHLGNLVPRKAELVGSLPGQKPDLFVSVPFEDLIELGQYHDSAIKGDLDPEGSRLTKSDRQRLVVEKMKLKRFF